MTALPPRLLAGIVAGALAVGGLLAGCGSPTPGATPAATGSAPGTSSGAVPLPWPATGAAEAAGLQQRVDDGAQPWLLDPAEVALSYVTAAHGWSGAGVNASVDGGTVDVTGPDGERRTLTLRQPGTTGPGGIWVVTAEIPTP